MGERTRWCLLARQSACRPTQLATLRRYLAACAVEGFDPDTPLFAASGIFGAMDALAEANMAVVRRELASHVFHKNQARARRWGIPQRVAALGSHQHAAKDSRGHQRQGTQLVSVLLCVL